jgi:hypothetical protein
MNVQIADVEGRIRVRYKRDEHVVPVVIDWLQLQKRALVRAQHLFKFLNDQLNVY